MPPTAGGADGIVFGFALAAAVACVCIIALHMHYPTALALAVAAAACAVVLIYRPSLISSGLTLTAATGILMALISLEMAVYAQPFRQKSQTRRPIGAAITQLVGSERLYTYHPGYAPFMYYVRCPVDELGCPGCVNEQVKYVLLAGRDAARQPMLEQLANSGFYQVYQVSLQEGTWQLYQRPIDPAATQPAAAAN